MKQRRRTSFIESTVNVAVGLIIATLGQIIVFPYFGIHVPLIDNLWIALIFTGVSVVRSYGLRRLFEHLRHTGKFA